MFQNSFRIALRQMFRDRSTTILHLFGLGLGLTAFLLIAQFVIFETSYDRFHTKIGRLGRVEVDIERSGRANLYSAASYAGTGPALKNDFPEVETFTRMVNGESVIRSGDQSFRLDGVWYVDADFFNMFSLPLLAGDARTALSAPRKAVITERAALRIFGETECVGKSFEAQNWIASGRFEVAGVAENLPENTHLTGDIFFSYATTAAFPGGIPDWNWRDFKTYVLLKEGADWRSFEQKLTQNDWLGAKNPTFLERQTRHKIRLQPVENIYLAKGPAPEQELKATGDAGQVNYLALIAALVLGMAWINYANLSTARAVEHGDELSVRKAVGARRIQLLGPFLAHAFLLNATALGLAWIAVKTIQPFFENLVGKPVNVVIGQSPYWAQAATAFLVSGFLISAFYPAWAATAIAGSLFSGTKKTVGGVTLRKGMIVIQFAVSTALIIGTLLVQRQLDFMRKKDLGMSIDHTVVVRAPMPTDSATYSQFLVFRQKLLESPEILSATASSNVAGDEDTWNTGVRRWSAADPESQFSLIAHVNAVEPNFFEQYDLKILSGRVFQAGRSSDARSAVFTETTARRFGFERPEEAVGERIVWRGEPYDVIGVIADYHQYGARRLPEPYVFFQDPTELRRYSIKIKPGADISSALATIEKTWRGQWPEGAYENFFLDTHYDKTYRAELRLGKLFGMFSGTAILIACLGLFGLAAFTATRRRKEIGIRKVLGATTGGVVGLLSKDFMKLVVLSWGLAFPAAYYFMNNWLRDFAYRIDIQWNIFIYSGILIALTACLTVSFQSLKAALANPVKSLRNE